jgi:hypothetical protein
MIKDPTPRSPLFHWMAERERIRQAREAGAPGPWTDDPAMRDFYYTNEMREHDTVSRFIQSTITGWYSDNSALPMMLGLARHLNRPEPITYLLDVGAWPEEATPQALRRAARHLEVFEQQGGRVWTGAYVVNATEMGNYPDRFRGKIDCVVNGTVGNMLKVGWPMTSIEAFTTSLARARIWGGFMAYEVACDLRWAPGWLDRAPDIYTWANPGPGALKGLRLLYGLERDPSRPEAIEMMRTLLAEAEVLNWPVTWVRQLEMRDIEHSLCEFSKYVTIASGGRAKRRYPQP